MIIRAKAPLRISFAGGITDMPFYYMEHGGAVLSSTINRYAYVTLSMRQERTIEICSLDFDLSVKYHLDEEPVYNGVLDLAKAAIHRVIPRDNHYGFDIYVQSDAPAGSGLGGSASLTLAVIGTLAELAKVTLDPYQIAELAYEVERTDLKISGGKQDQYTIAFGGFNLIEFSKDGVVVNPLRIDKSTLNELEYHLMLCYTGKTRLSAGLIDQQERYYEQGRAETIEGLKNLHKLTYKMKDALLTGKLSDFAEMLDFEWMNKVKINPQVTTDWIDEMYATARQNGVIGGKLLGAGAGGYLLLFCKIDKKRTVREKLEKMGGQFTEFSFVDDGLQVWRGACL